MNEREFIKIVREEVAKYTNEHLDRSDNKQITTDDVFIVWNCKTLQNNKALASTTLFDGMYYEVTYNGDKNEIYFDAYKKWENKCISFNNKKLDRKSAYKYTSEFDLNKYIKKIERIYRGEYYVERNTWLS